MRHLNYNFTSLENTFSDAISAKRITNSHIRVIKNELNKFFGDSKCEDIYYTDNNDKMFFGMKVYSRIDPDKIYDYLLENDDIRIAAYTVEIDSHLFNPVLGLGPKEMVALLLHEVGHVVNDITPVERARNYLDEYLAKNNKTFTSTSANTYNHREMLAFALSDFISKQGSIFYNGSTDEIIADDFVRAYGYGEYLDSAFKSITKNYKNLYTGNDKVDKFSVFMWTLDLHGHLATRRIAAIRTLNRAKALTGSKLEKMKIDNLIRNINRIDDSPINEVSVSNRVSSRMKKMRYNTMRNLEDDLYELTMRVRNTDEEDDALYLMRQINTRINLIADYLESEDMSPNDVRRWTDSLDKFKKVREELANTATYKNKSYGIFVAYPEIKENNY